MILMKLTGSAAIKIIIILYRTTKEYTKNFALFSPLWEGIFVDDKGVYSTSLETVHTKNMLHKLFMKFTSTDD